MDSGRTPLVYLPELGQELQFRRQREDSLMDSMKVGDQVWIVIRSESVALRQSPSGSGQWLKGKVVERSFLGASSRFYLKTEEGDKLIIADVKWEASAAHLPEQQLYFGWDENDVMLFRKN